MHHSTTSTYKPNFIEIEETFCGRTDVQTDVRSLDEHLRPTLLGRLGVDLKMALLLQVLKSVYTSDCLVLYLHPWQMTNRRENNDKIIKPLLNITSTSMLVKVEKYPRQV